MLIIESIVVALVIDWVAGMIGIPKLFLLGILSYLFGGFGLVLGVVSLVIYKFLQDNHIRVAVTLA
ncbi:hypothetical protein [Alicyclobacillus fodiniaquatilis]|uniref:Uncharacterized protein n=1 Tax=Alicyclobacillus fodiniaquatilis TaxID=1661150 RepID=A0ABW4JK71_9BACL